jgi:hypothetical protein
MGRTACTEPQCLYSRAIPLLSLWDVRPVQSLSACTVELYLYSPYGTYGLYRASVTVQGCTLFTFFIFFIGEVRTQTIRMIFNCRNSRFKTSHTFRHILVNYINIIMYVNIYVCIWTKYITLAEDRRWSYRVYMSKYEGKTLLGRPMRRRVVKVKEKQFHYWPG